MQQNTSVDWEQLHLDVAFGRAGGKVLWQPRICAWFTDREFFGEPMPAPYTGMSLSDLYRALGCSNRIYEFNWCFVAHEDPAVRVSTRQLNEWDVEVLWETPVGSHKAINRRSPHSPWPEPLKWPISDEADMRVAMWREAHRTWTWDEARYRQLREEWKGLGAPTAYLLRTTIAHLFVTEMGVEPSIYALMDYPDLCEAYFEALNHNQNQLLDLMCESPIQIINFGDNLHSSTTPPALFKQYMLPLYQERCEKLHAAGKFISAHWDGNVKPLLPLAKETGLDGIEAITPLPQGDVTLEETKAALGDEMFLLDGIPAVYFDTTYSEKELLDCARKCIDLFAPKLILGISDEISARGVIERVRLVGDLVEEYNASL